MVIGAGFRQTAEFLIYYCFMDNLENKLAASTTGGNFYEFKIRRAV
jgi:hypothetical protein